MPMIPPEQSSKPASLARFRQAILSSYVWVVQMFGKLRRDVSMLQWNRLTPAARSRRNCSSVSRPRDPQSCIFVSRLSRVNAWTVFSKSSALSVRPAVTIEKRWTPRSSLCRHSFRMVSGAKNGYSLMPVQLWADCAQKRQFSEHFPLLALMMLQRSTLFPQKCFRIRFAPSQRFFRSAVIKKSISSPRLIRLPAMISSASFKISIGTSILKMPPDSVPFSCSSHSVNVISIHLPRVPAVVPEYVENRAQRHERVGIR